MLLAPSLHVGRRTDDLDNVPCPAARLAALGAGQTLSCPQQFPFPGWQLQGLPPDADLSYTSTAISDPGPRRGWRGLGGLQLQLGWDPLRPPTPRGLCMPGAGQQSQWAGAGAGGIRAAAAVPSRHSSHVGAERGPVLRGAPGRLPGLSRWRLHPPPLSLGPSPSLSRRLWMLGVGELVGGGAFRAAMLLLSANIRVRALPPASRASSLSERLSREPPAWCV